MNMFRCPFKDWYAGRCELVRGHRGSHFARWYGSGDQGYATWDGSRDNTQEDDKRLRAER